MSSVETFLQLCGSWCALHFPLQPNVCIPRWISAGHMQVVMFHALAFWIGRQLAANTIAKGQAGVPLARAISLQTGMQSSLLALLLATRYFSDPLVRLPCGLSVVVMTLAGFGLVLLWGRDTQSADEDILQTEMQ